MASRCSRFRLLGRLAAVVMVICCSALPRPTAAEGDPGMPFRFSDATAPGPAAAEGGGGGGGGGGLNSAAPTKQDAHVAGTDVPFSHISLSLFFKPPPCAASASSLSLMTPGCVKPYTPRVKPRVIYDTVPRLSASQRKRSVCHETNE